jgi:hypothetical protein
MRVRRVGLVLVAVNGSLLERLRARPTSLSRLLPNGGRAGRTTLRAPVARGPLSGLGGTYFPADRRASLQVRLVRDDYLREGLWEAHGSCFSAGDPSPALRQYRMLAARWPVASG